MSAYETLLKELAGQPDSVARKLLDYLHAVAPHAEGTKTNGDFPSYSGCFSAYWKDHYGSFDGEEWDEPRDLPFEKREEW